MAAQTFAKAERLHSKKIIQELFTKGSSFYLHPFKVLILQSPEGISTQHQLLISVSKRNFKKAVDRNLLKRRIREGFRLQKGTIQPNPILLMAFIYTGKTILPSKEIHQTLFSTLTKVSLRQQGMVNKSTNTQ